MKESLWGYWLVLLGIMIISVMILLQNYTTTDQQDYYLAKEVTYAAMYDAIDYGYYKKHGELKIIKEKFVENFVRRFAENATLNKTYKVNIYTIYELPPSVSIEIVTSTGDFRVGEDSLNAGITTRLTAILELNGKSESGVSLPQISPSTTTTTTMPITTTITTTTKPITTTITTTTKPTTITPNTTPEEIFVTGTYYDFPYGSNYDVIQTSIPFGTRFSNYNNKLVTDLYNTYVAKMNSKGKTPKNSDEFNKNVKITIGEVSLIQNGSGNTLSEYEDFVNVLCYGNSCSEPEGGLSNYIVKQISDYETYVPHSVLYKIKNSSFESYFGSGTFELTPKLYNFSSPAESSSFNNITNLFVKWKIKFNRCNLILDESVGIERFRKAFNSIYNHSVVVGNVSSSSSKGYFSAYDYFYQPKENESDRSNYSDINGMGTQPTPYYGNCLLGVRYNIKYSYKIDYDVE